jgi:hypothetical protein
MDGEHQSAVGTREGGGLRRKLEKMRQFSLISCGLALGEFSGRNDGITDTEFRVVSV